MKDRERYQPKPVVERPCRFCGGPMRDPRRKQCGSRACAAKQRGVAAAASRERATRWWAEHRDEALARKRAPRKPCAYCADETTTGRTTCGEPACQKALARDRAREYQRKRYAEFENYARARGAPKRESFRRLEIFERDGWICQLCDEPVDPTLRRPDLGCPSLDHIVPLSRGGSHTRENVQLAHLRCNLVKGAVLRVRP